MEYTWLGIAAGIILLLSCYNGFRRGFVKELVSTCFVLLAIVIVWLINPYVDTFLQERTPVYDKIQEACMETVEQQMEGISATGAEAQDALIESLPLPEFLKGQLETYNNENVYGYLVVESFESYIASAVATMLTNGLGFVLSYLLATIMIHALAYVLNLIAKLPILRGVNRMAGVLMGGVRGILFIWVVLLILTIFCNTSWGQECMTMIERDPFLSFLYDSNIFVKIFMSMFY